MYIQLKYTYEEYNATHSISVDELQNMLIIKPNTLGESCPLLLDTGEKAEPIGIIKNIEFDDENKLIVVNAFVYVKSLHIEIQSLDRIEKFANHDLDVEGVILTTLGSNNGNSYIYIK